MPDRRQFLQAGSALAASAALPAASRAATAAAMLSRPIPSSGAMLPVIGLGTANTFDVSPDESTLAPLAGVVRALFEAGGTVIDTAPTYGRAEPVTGILLKNTGRLGEAFIATKVSGVRGRESGLAQVRRSLADLHVERVDLLQVHNLGDLDTQLALLRELQRQGVTRYVGITHYTDGSHERMTELVEREKLDFVQINLSVTARGAERRLLPACRDRGVAVLINRPFRDGALFRAVRNRPLPDWAAEIECASWAQLFLKYVVSHPAVTAVIPATSRPANMADNARAGFGPQPDEAMRRRIAALFD